jgi:hypothetical protein
MAFDDFRRVIEDTIRVDMKKRWTPQLVKFINNKNEFYGFFNGEISATGGFLSDVNLSNITIYKSDGSELDIDEVIEMRDRLDIYDIHFMNLSTVVSIELPTKIQLKVNELSVKVYNSIDKVYKSISELSGEFFEKIQSSNEEVYKTITDVSDLISVRIDNVEANLLSNKLELKADISKLNEKVDQKVDEIYLSIDTFEQNTKNEFE